MNFARAKVAKKVTFVVIAIRHWSKFVSYVDKENGDEIPPTDCMLNNLRYTPYLP
jgi:hypothetical protein